MLQRLIIKFIYGFLIGFFIVLVILTMKNSQTTMPLSSLLYNSLLTGAVCGLFFSFIQLLFYTPSNVDDGVRHGSSSSNNYIDDNYDGSNRDGGCDNDNY